MKRLIFALTLVTAACAQPALAPPQVGFIQDSENALRPVFGIAGNFILGDAISQGITSSAYSGSLVLLKTDSAIVATDVQGQVLQSMDAPPGPALFALYKDGSPAFAYLESVNLLFEWCGSGFQMVRFDGNLFLADSVLSIFAPDALHVGFLVRRGGDLLDVRIAVDSGESDSQATINGVTAPALILASGDIVYADADGLVIRRADASEVHLNAQLPSGFSLAQMGAGWVALTDFGSGAQFAVRVTPGREGIYTLPGVNQ